MRGGKILRSDIQERFLHRLQTNHPVPVVFAEEAGREEGGPNRSQDTRVLRSSQ